jgi:hypothetical protein
MIAAEGEVEKESWECRAFGESATGCPSHSFAARGVGFPAKTSLSGLSARIVEPYRLK